MLSPGFDSTFPLVGTAPPGFRPLPQAAPPARLPVAQQQAPGPRIVRGQQPDEPPPAPVLRQPPLRMPSPQELGVADVKQPENPNLDWTAVHKLLDRLGVTCFHLERMAAGGYRVTCLLPTSQPGRTHCIEAEGATEAEAVRLTLTKVQQWAQGP